MRVGDRHGQRIGGIGAGDLHARQQDSDHGLHLLLVRPAGADHGLLDQPRGMFVDRQPGGPARTQLPALRATPLLLLTTTCYYLLLTTY